MDQWLLQNQTFLRFGIFLGLFSIFAIWEIVKPDHVASLPRQTRWTSNLLLIALNTITLRVLFPITAVGVAEYATHNHFGFLRIWIIPDWAFLFLGLLFLDFVIYTQHILFHAIPALWKFHQMHHADLDLDVTSGTRFHPIEIILSMFIKWSAILLSGVSPLTVILFEMILNGMAMFNHSNIFIPNRIDRLLRYILITPSLHQIHHSVLASEHNSNYGFNLSIWDRLLGTLTNASNGKLTLGLPIYRDLKYSKLHWMLSIPFIHLKEKADLTR